MNNQKVRVHVFISGRVQGVFFRSQTRREAKKIGITGWIKNLADGRVEAVFEGEEKQIKTMIEWARKGPLFAKVNGIEFEYEEPSEELSDFEIAF